uniref:Ig-like domain-containing protein n=1 Tax=Sander lucioperca TaxID=283035 RepID=A0A8C9ZJE6_SANLU
VVYLIILPMSGVQGESCNRVTYTDRSICASEGSSVDISCTYSSYEDQVESKLWFSRERNHRGQNPSQPEDLSTDSQYTGRVHVETERRRSTLRISDLRERDSAEYHFKFITPNFEWRSSLPGTTLTVATNPLQPTSTGPSAEIVEGSSVTLTCSSDANPAANYTWYKENVYFRPPREEPQLVFSSIQSSDSGQYYLISVNTSPPDGPKLPSVSVSPSAEIVEGSSVTLTCSSDANPAANYTWYKENQTLPHGQQGIYHFTSISSEDRGNYYCKSENQHGHINSTSLFIDVHKCLWAILYLKTGQKLKAKHNFVRVNTILSGPQNNHEFTKCKEEKMRSVIYHFKHLEQKPSPLYLHLYSHARILYSDACAPHTQLSRDVCALKHAVPD